MYPGPTSIYYCPKCKNIIYNESVASGNTFGATLYSDIKSIKPMYRDYPDITKCSKCNTIFWLNKENEEGTYSISSVLTEKLKEVEKARFLNLYEYADALEMKIFKTKDEEIYIRRGIWWGFNDRVRNDEPLFSSEADKILWTNNALQLIELFDINEINQKISIAELYRNLGDFEKCKEIINSIENSDYDWLKTAYKNECNKKNTQLFLLKNGNKLNRDF